MNISQASAIGSMVSNQMTGDAVGLTVLKKALANDTQTAAQFINSVPQPAKAADISATLGQNINVKV